MFVDLTTGINSEDIDHSSFAVHGEQDAPAPDTGLSDFSSVGERGRKSRIEWVNSELHEACANTLFGRPVKSI